MANRKALRKEVMSLTSKLEATYSDLPKAGYLPLWGGGYWNEEYTNLLLLAKRELASLETDPDEKAAAEFSYAGYLVAACRLDEAVLQLTSLIERRPAQSVGAQNLLALVKARTGDLQKAREIAKALNENPNARLYHVSDETLEKEYRIGSNR